MTSKQNPKDDIKAVAEAASQRKDLSKIIESTFDFSSKRSPKIQDKVKWDIQVNCTYAQHGNKPAQVRPYFSFGRIFIVEDVTYSTVIFGNGKLENKSVMLAMFNATAAMLKKSNNNMIIRTNKIGTMSPFVNIKAAKKITGFFNLALPTKVGQNFKYFFSLHPIEMPSGSGKCYLMELLPELTSIIK